MKSSGLMLVFVRIIAVVLLFGLLAFVFLDIYSGVLKFKRDNYIFENISQCENIAEIFGTKEKFVRYQNASKDEHLFGLKYKDFYAGKYESILCGYEIFAYEFENTDDARKYFNTSSNTTWGNEEYPSAFAVRVSIWSSRMYAISGTSCYTINTTRLGEVIFLSRAKSVFSKKIE